MKKIISLLMILFLFCGCGANEEEKVPEESEDQPDEWGITFSVENITREGATFVFSQSGGSPTGELITGSYYRIEKDGEELPYVVEGEIGWTAEAYAIMPEKTSFYEVNWKWLYGELEPGTYRIFKQVSDFCGPGDFNDREYSAEFVIE